MSTDEKERAISQYNRQRAKTRRKAATHEDVPETKSSVEIEPLVQEQESRSRRSRKAKATETTSQIVTSQGPSDLGQDHPIMKRKRVKRDLSQVIFGPTQ